MRKIGRRFSALASKISESRFLIAIRSGFTLMIPLMMIGSLCLFMNNIPIDAYQSFMVRVFGENWKDFFGYLYQGTFTIMSLGMVLAISYSLADSYSRRTALGLHPMVAALVSLGSYFVLIYIDRFVAKDYISTDTIGTMGVFISIVTAVLSSVIFCRLMSIKRLRIKMLNNSADPAFEQAFASLIPGVLTMLTFVLVRVLFRAMGIENIQARLYQWLQEAFLTMPSSAMTSIVYVLIMHVLWFFGIHGSNVLEPLAESIFTPARDTNMWLYSMGATPTHIFTKEFFDAFVVLGGCGATLCLILALLFNRRRKRNAHRKIAMFGILPGLINVNEVMIFGVPIVFNIYLLVPFILVPITLTLITAGAMSIGFIHPTISEVGWTTPVILSGFTATGQVSGSILQVFNLIIGAMIYTPFIRLYERQAARDSERVMSHMFDEIEQLHKQPKNVLRSRNDDVGNLARALSNSLIEAIRYDSDELYLVIQPQMHSDGHMAGAECLLRWKDELQGNIPAPITIALAEDSDCMDALGLWVMREAIRIQSKLIAEGIDVPLSFNVSPLQLNDPGLSDKLEQYLNEFNVDPTKMELEITEEAALESTPEHLALLDRFKKIGVKLAMDDFGMGHGSLRHLEEFGLDVIKLDGSIVRGLTSNEANREILNSIVYLCESIGMDVVAEYVENEELRDILKAHGCHIYQGYYYSAPLSFDEFVNYYRANAADKPTES